MREISITACVIGVVFAAQLLQPAFVARADWRSYDFLDGFTPRAAPSGQVAIVAVDESSLARFGRWPWPRDVLGLIVGKLLDAGVRAVVLDLMFPEPDQSQPGVAQLVRRGVVAPSEVTPARERTNDAVLAECVARGRVVAGYSFDFRNASGSTGCVLQPVPLATATREGLGPPVLYKAPGVLCTVAAITQAAAATGFLNAAPDADGLLRRVPLLVEYENRAYPSLALATLLAARPKNTVSLVSGGMGSHELHIEDLIVPVDKSSSLLVRFRGGRAFPSTPAADVVTTPAVAASLANKVVILGGSAAGLQDRVATPADPSMLGVEVQANIIDNLLTGDFVQRSGLAPLWEALLVVLCSAATAIALHRMRPLAGALAMLVCCVALWAGAAVILSRARNFVSPFLPTVAVAINFAALTVSSRGRQRDAAERAEHDLDAMRRFALAAMTAMTEVRHAETGGHAKRLQRYMGLLCEELADHPRFGRFITPRMVVSLIELTPVHDIGKVGIPDSVLLKDGPLTPEEFSIIRRHVEHGREILESARKQSGLQNDRLFQLACDIVCAHHERWDGNGYPNGLRGDAIPIPARLLAVADVYDALVSKRVYKDAMMHRAACETIMAGRGTHFDPDVVDAFLARHEAWEAVAAMWCDQATGQGAGA